jgi:2-keto-4-pentenoate hydratase/2-oxohepta-3-ene-1,7-dioic acid hydratase in catechol pathway
MKLVTFTHDRSTHNGSTRIGALTDDGILGLEATGFEDMLALLNAGDAGMEAARKAIAAGGECIAVDSVKLEAPVPRPGKVLAIALNYAEHVAETGSNVPPVQMWFNKQTTCVNAPFDPIHKPIASDMVDYEGELGVIIGKTCRHVPASRAFEVIAGYTIVDDVSVRDWQARAATFQIGKSFDTHGPIGPYLVTPDEIGDPEGLALRTWVNDEIRQDSNTRHMIHKIAEQIEHLTTAFTLEPGDVLATGTPSGVGAAMKPAQFLKAGDKVRIEIENVGEITHAVIAEPGGTRID